MPVIFFKMLDRADANWSSGGPESKTRAIYILRYYNGFNLQQREKLPVPESLARHLALGFLYMTTYESLC